MSESDEMQAACEVIEELMRPCEKCGKTARGGRWSLLPDAELVLCQECYADQDGLSIWFEQELESAMQASGEYERMPDGKWRKLTI